MNKFFMSKKNIIFSIAALGILVTILMAVFQISPKFFGGGRRESAYRTIFVEEVIGTVIVENEKEGQHKAYKGLRLVSGDEITVSENSCLTLKVDGDKYIIADAGTHFWVEASGDNTSKKNMRTYIYMDSGSILNRLDEKLGVEEVYEVQTPNSTAAVRGTTFRVTVYKDINEKDTDIQVENYTQIEVLKGVVNVELETEEGKKAGESRDLEAGESALIHSNPEISEFVDSAKTENKDHIESATVVIEATCTEDGLCEIRCVMCNEFLGASVIEKTGHTESVIVVKEATCTEDGLCETKCVICDEILKTTALEKKGHTEGEWIISKEATCEQAGVKNLFCTVCEEKLKSEEIPLKGHQFEEFSLKSKDGCKITTVVKKICNICNEENIVSEAVVENHSYGAWITEKEATCSEEGESARSCSVCGVKEIKSIAKTDHTRDENEMWRVVVTPTCLEAGQKRIPCGVCGEWIYEATYAECSREYTKEGHDISGVDYSNTSGYQSCNDTETCTLCGKSVTATHLLKVELVTNSDGSQDTKLRCATCGVEW